MLLAAPAWGPPLTSHPSTRLHFLSHVWPRWPRHPQISRCEGLFLVKGAAALEPGLEPECGAGLSSEARGMRGGGCRRAPGARPEWAAWMGTPPPSGKSPSSLAVGLLPPHWSDRFLVSVCFSFALGVLQYGRCCPVALWGALVPTSLSRCCEPSTAHTRQAGPLSTLVCSQEGCLTSSPDLRLQPGLGALPRVGSAASPSRGRVLVLPLEQ